MRRCLPAHAPTESAKCLVVRGQSDVPLVQRSHEDHSDSIFTVGGRMGKRSVAITLTAGQSRDLGRLHSNQKGDTAVSGAVSGGAVVGRRPAQRNTSRVARGRPPTGSSVAASLGPWHGSPGRGRDRGRDEHGSREADCRSIKGRRPPRSTRQIQCRANRRADRHGLPAMRPSGPAKAHTS